MKSIFYGLIFLLLAGLVTAVPVKITGAGEAYGHHGNCFGWNDCGNAANCALKACQANGYNTLVFYGDDKPCTQFNMCHLFDTNWTIDCNWGNWCDVRGVTDIWCDDGTLTLQCRAELPEQSDPPSHNGGGGEIPEFGVLAGTVAMIGALAVFVISRKRA